MPDEPAELTASRDLTTMNMRDRAIAWHGDSANGDVAFDDTEEAGSVTASSDLAQLLTEPVGGHGAIAAFQRAVRRGRAAPEYSLGGLIAETGDASGLIKAYSVAAKCGDQGAAYQLGLLYLDRGDLGSARSAFARADNLGHSWAAFGLGEILERTGDRSGAIAAYRRAVDRKVPTAHARLEALLTQSGDTHASVAVSAPDDQTASAEPAKRDTRRRLAWIAGTVAALAALLIVLLLTLLPSAGKSPAPRLGTAHATGGTVAPAPLATGGAASRARTAHPTTTPGTLAAAGGVGIQALPIGSRLTFRAPATVFTSKESALLDSIPGASDGECLTRAEAPLPRSDASIRCVSASVGVTALYYGYSSVTVLRHVFHDYRAWFTARHKLRECTAATHGKYFQGSDVSNLAGRWACFYNDRTVPGSACIDWADYGLLIFGSACQVDGNFKMLARWWSHAGPVPASTVGLTNRL
ncbi:MAG TPA: hypothetical protein VGG41_01045 [Solirubrobacteraceae bacterium]|jgi:hypothetical protein